MDLTQVSKKRKLAEAPSRIPTVNELVAAKFPAVIAKQERIRAAAEIASRKMAPIIVELFEALSAGQQWIGHRDPGQPIPSVTFARTCKRKVEAGEDGYLIIGRNYYMSPERHAEALKDLSEKRVRKTKEPRESVANELGNLLKCLKGGRR